MAVTGLVQGAQAADAVRDASKAADAVGPGAGNAAVKQKMDALDKLDLALTAVGLIPVPGLQQGANAGSALIALARGDLLGVALSVGSMVPMAGVGAGLAKLQRIGTRLGIPTSILGKFAKDPQAAAKELLAHLHLDPEFLTAPLEAVKKHLEIKGSELKDLVKRPSNPHVVTATPAAAPAPASDFERLLQKDFVPSASATKFVDDVDVNSMAARGLAQAQADAQNLAALSQRTAANAPQNLADLIRQRPADKAQRSMDGMRVGLAREAASTGLSSAYKSLKELDGVLETAVARIANPSTPAIRSAQKQLAANEKKLAVDKYTLGPTARAEYNQVETATRELRGTVHQLEQVEIRSAKELIEKTIPQYRTVANQADHLAVQLARGGSLPANTDEIVTQMAKVATADGAHAARIAEQHVDAARRALAERRLTLDIPPVGGDDFAALLAKPSSR